MPKPGWKGRILARGFPETAFFCYTDLIPHTNTMSAAAFRAKIQTMTFMPQALIQYLAAGADAMTPKDRESTLNKFGRAATLATAAMRKAKDRVAGIGA